MKFTTNLSRIPVTKGFFLALLFSIFSFVNYAQSTDELTYKFTIDGILTNTQAKPIQYEFFNETYTVRCNFYEEEACFKLTSNTRLNYKMLHDMISALGLELSNEVYVSDETILRANPKLNFSE